MNLLLDTHIALWAITDSPKLPKKAREMIESPKSSIWISAATVWLTSWSTRRYTLATST